MQGGFYRYDLPSKANISVLSVNSILMNNKNDEQETQSVEAQLAWLESQLSNARGRKFLLHMHIPPGQWFQVGLDTYWKDKYLESYLGVIAKYQDSVSMILAAHAHPGEVRAPKSTRYPDLDVTIMMTPSISPLGLLQPGYSILDFPVQAGLYPSAVWRYLQLHDYIIYQWPSFSTLDIQQSFNITLGNAPSIRAFQSSLKNDTDKYTHYLFAKMGYADWLIKIAQGLIVKAWAYSKVFDQKSFVCGMENYESEGYQACLAE
ncbi:hypothetical protein FGO68_gene16121 [Halteria grandinella]|uniref:Uncharacterized protein n=1 Tax=Halteria grandinella TaxID=5974 RepID=A0A8J8NQI3_HALGN|nr:hypothetical protein FGO68_gene16121 [Halteria grandinella]